MIHLDELLSLMKSRAPLGADAKRDLRSFITINGESILHFCAIENDSELVKLAFDCGVDINKKNKFSRTALMEISALGCYSMAKLLIDLGADISCADGEGNTALHLAFMNKAPKKVVDLLLMSGADPLRKNAFGETPERAI